MPSELSRKDVNGLSSQVKKVLVAHCAGPLGTESARDELEQIVASAAGQLGEQDRRAVARFAEFLIGAVWSDTLSIEDACIRVERIATAAAENDSAFQQLIKVD